MRWRMMIVMVVLAGCSASGDRTGVCGDGACGGQGGGGGAGGVGGVGGTSGTGGGCMEGVAQQCICPNNNAVGMRTCVGGTFGACMQCADASVPPASPCTPGRYVGQLTMPEYYPNAAGLCGITTLFGGMDIAAEFAFTLGDSSDPAHEFLRIVGPESCLEVDLPSASAAADGGALDGGTDGGASVQTQPLRLAFSGTVDCFTGELTGELRGAYYSESLCNLGTIEDWYSVKGTLTGTFNTVTRSFDDGVIDLQEPPGLFDSLGLAPRNGGAGPWTATLDPAAPPQEPVADCLDGAPWTDFELVPR